MLSVARSPSSFGLPPVCQLLWTHPTTSGNTLLSPSKNVDRSTVITRNTVFQLLPLENLLLSLLANPDVNSGSPALIVKDLRLLRENSAADAWAGVS